VKLENEIKILRANNGGLQTQVKCLEQSTLKLSNEKLEAIIKVEESSKVASNALHPKELEKIDYLTAKTKDLE